MRRLVFASNLLALILLLNLATSMRAQGAQLPPCTRAEFRTIFDLIAESQLELGETISSRDELIDFARTQIEGRDSGTLQSPLCSDAFAYQRLIVELTGDFIGRTALDLSDMPAEQNPYRIQLAGDQERIEDLAAGMLSVDRSEAPEPALRSLAKCSLDELTALDAVVADYSTLQARDVDDPAADIEARLTWRDEQLAQIPTCVDGIELALLLSDAVTDSATQIALASIAPEDENPYVSLAAESADRLSSWRDQLEALRANRSDGSSTYAGLPNCTMDELASAYDRLMPEYSDLLGSARQISSAADLRDYSEAYFSYRSTNLRQLPACVEAFTVGWEARQLLGDLVSGTARDMIEIPVYSNPFSDRIDEGSDRVARLIDGLARQLEGAGGGSSSAPVETAAVCGQAELIYLHYYLVPAFHSFGEAALSIETWDDIFALNDRSLSLRDLIWRELPRCAEAIELGLVMRRIAADFIAMLWLEAAGLPVDEIPQVTAVAEAMIWLSVQTDKLDVRFESATPAGQVYFIIAGRGANIRACSSTDCAIVTTALTGEAIQVIDDSGSWYQVSLPNDQVGYIASFLVSETPADS